jgi:hypothetical protein
MAGQSPPSLEVAVPTDPGQAYKPADDELSPVLEYLAAMAGPDQAKSRAGIFWPVVQVPADASLLDRILGLSGRDPSWRAA